MMDINSGKAISKENSLKQSIDLILRTPKGERVLNREFGCNVGSYIDAPLNSVGMQLSAEIINSLNKCDPRIRVEQALLSNSKGTLSTEIRYNSDNMREGEAANVELK